MKRVKPSDVLSYLIRLYPNCYTRCQPKPSISSGPMLDRATRQRLLKEAEAKGEQPEPVDMVYQAGIKPKRTRTAKDFDFSIVDEGTLEELVERLKAKWEAVKTP